MADRSEVLDATYDEAVNRGGKKSPGTPGLKWDWVLRAHGPHRQCRLPSVAIVRCGAQVRLGAPQESIG